MTFKEEIYDLESRLIAEALVSHSGAISPAARSLGLEHGSLLWLMSRHPELKHLRLPPRARKPRPKWGREAI